MIFYRTNGGICLSYVTSNFDQNHIMTIPWLTRLVSYPRFDGISEPMSVAGIGVCLVRMRNLEIKSNPHQYHRHVSADIAVHALRHQTFCCQNVKPWLD